MSNMLQGLDLSKIQFPDMMGIREAALFLGKSEQYVRTLLRSKQLVGKNDESTDRQWQIRKVDLEAFKTREPKTRGGGQRGEGKAFVIKVKYADLPKVEAALKQLGIALQPRYTYKAKAKKADAGTPPAAPVKK